MKSIKFKNDDCRMEQIVKVKMTLFEKIKFVCTGKLTIPYFNFFFIFAKFIYIKHTIF